MYICICVCVLRCYISYVREYTLVNVLSLNIAILFLTTNFSFSFWNSESFWEENFRSCGKLEKKNLGEKKIWEIWKEWEFEFDYEMGTGKWET